MTHYLESLVGVLSSENSFVPELEYEPIEYIGLSGGSYIATDITMQDKLVFVIQQQILNDASSKAIFGYASNYNVQSPRSEFRNNEHFYYLDNSYNSSLRYASSPLELCTVRYYVDIDTFTVYLDVNDEAKSIVKTSSIVARNPFSVGTNRRDEYAVFCNNYKIYSVKAYDVDNNVVVDYQPCKLKSTNEYGLWDKVTDTFISVSGNGTIFVP